MKPAYVLFNTKKLEDDFEKLSRGKYEDRVLYDRIQTAILKMKNNPTCGKKIQKKIWLAQYKVKNLWKYNLSSSWRLLYTIKEDQLMIVNVILEWLDHKSYERRFAY
jgi:hypothetical protein